MTWKEFVEKHGGADHIVGWRVLVNGSWYLIGDINPNRGVCDDCTMFEPDAIVTAYQKVADQG